MTTSIRRARLQLELVAGNGPRTTSIAQLRRQLDGSVRNTPRAVTPEARDAGQRRAIAYRKQEVEAAKRGLKAVPGSARRERAVFTERRNSAGFTTNQVIEGRRRLYSAMFESRAMETR